MDWMLFQVLNHYIPAAYMPLIVIILGAFLAFEQYLAATKRIKANSTLQLIVGFVQYFVGKEKGNGQGNVMGPGEPAQEVRPEQVRGPALDGGHTTGVIQGGRGGIVNDREPEWLTDKGRPGQGPGK
jgi:hypothetical protein